MNILEQEDIIKGLPDAALMKEASAPSGQVPQFLVVSEIKRRSDMRKRFEKEQEPQGTVKDQIVMEAMGIAPMMPSAMTPPQPPAAPMGAPPMGGMPPQGMPPMAPPQAPKPPMPMGGIASAPQAMPPMGMAQGGIVQMQGGGFLDSYVPQAQLGPVQGGSTVKDQIDRLIDGKMMSAADILSFAQEAFYGQPEAINYVITRLGGAGAGMEPVGGMTAEDQEAVSEAAPMRMMPKLAGGSDLYKGPMVVRAADALGLFDSYKSKPEDDRMLEPAASALAQQVVDEYAVPDMGIRGIFNSSMPAETLSPEVDPPEPRSLPLRAAGAGQGLGFLESTGLDALLQSRGSANPLGRMRKPKDDAAVQGASPAQVQANGMLSEYTDYTALTDKEGKLLFPAVAADEVAAQSPYSLEFLQRENAIAAAREKARNEDFSTFAGKTVNEKGESTPETKLVDAVTELPRNDKSAPELDFSDLIAEGKQQALANAMIQLGAGVASGDVSKGLAAAGTAAMKGTADARALDMKRRLAEYQAGREDIRRGEEAERFERQMTSKESQFDKQLAQLERKIDATIDVSNATTQRENLRALAGEVESLREQVLTMTPAEKARFRVLESQLYRMLGIEMPDAAVTAGLSGKDLSGLESLIGG